MASESDVPIVWPIHPRTERRIAEAGLRERLDHARLVVVPALGYFDFLALIANAELVITDSGGFSRRPASWGSHA